MTINPTLGKGLDSQGKTTVGFELNGTHKPFFCSKMFVKKTPNAAFPTFSVKVFGRDTSPWPSSHVFAIVYIPNNPCMEYLLRCGIHLW